MILNEVTKTILERRSIRAYKPEQISEEELETVLECGVNAPSGANRQQWFVSVMQDKAFLEEISEKLYAWRIANAASEEEIARINSRPRSAHFGAPTVLWCAYPAADGPANLGFLAENMVLTAASIGLGTCFLGGIMAYLKGTEEGKELVSRMKLPEGYELAYGLTLGYPAESPEAKPREKKWIRI
ncbi:MAG: nitroreductase family protein [Clostridia bacterium]|nr:nitroreductase family protein [Clostridia bacterium]